MDATSWQSHGNRVEVYGRSLFVVDSGANEQNDARPALLLLHGYPTSSHDYYRVLPTLSQHFRVIVHDHLGFGLSEKPLDYSYSLFEQTDIALLLWQQLGVRSAHVFAHDYGTSIATELLARWNQGFRPIDIRSITLCNGSVHIELAKLRFIQKLLRNPTIGPIIARLTRQRMFDRNLRNLWHDPATLPQTDLDTMWELLTRDNGRGVLPHVTQYLRDRVQFWHRWVPALQQSQLPLNFLWGTSDPITGREVAELHHAEAPGSQLELLEEVGHYPMLEAPDRWTESLLRLIS